MITQQHEKLNAENVAIIASITYTRSTFQKPIGRTNVSTTVIVPTVAANVAANVAAAEAAAAAQAAESARCQVVMTTYHPEVATRESARDYAHCVLRAYPDQTTPQENAWLKAGVGGVLLGAVLAGFLAAAGSSDDDSVLIRLFFGLAGAVFGGLAGGMIVGAAWLCVWLFS